jgi:hypothetical protein
VVLKRLAAPLRVLILGMTVLSLTLHPRRRAYYLAVSVRQFIIGIKYKPEKNKLSGFGQKYISNHPERMGGTGY